MTTLQLFWAAATTTSVSSPSTGTRWPTPRGRSSCWRDVGEVPAPLWRTATGTHSWPLLADNIVTARGWRSGNNISLWQLFQKARPFYKQKEISVMFFSLKLLFVWFQESNWRHSQACHNIPANGNCQKLRTKPRTVGGHQRRNWTVVVRRLAGWISGIRLEVHREGLELEEGGEHVGGQRGARGTPSPRCQVSFNSMMRKLTLKNGSYDFHNPIISYQNESLEVCSKSCKN